MVKELHQYDVAVLGGGPAGMIAAGRAAQLGASVVLIEKNVTLGKKLLLTGGGRCNLTNIGLIEPRALAKYKHAQKFLFSPFSKFGVQETLDFFHTYNMPTKVEAEGRVFPASNSSKTVLDALVAYMRVGKVEVLAGSAVSEFMVKDGVLVGVRLMNKKSVQAKAFILATGGKSHPATGSTGDGFRFLQELEHIVIEPDAALVPVKIKEPWVHRLSGFSMKEAKLTIYQNNKRYSSDTGKMLFTHFGLSGPLILNMSKSIGELLRYDQVVLALDLIPDTDIGTLEKILIKAFIETPNKQIKNVLSEFVPTTFVPILLKLSACNSDAPVNSVTREKRRVLVQIIKRLPMTPTGLMSADNAIVASGGVKCEEVDFKTMRSLKCLNLFIVGDMLNIDRPSGGYSLQLCWTTGYVAGENAVT